MSTVNPKLVRSDSIAEKIWAEANPAKSDEISREEFIEWYKASVKFEEHLHPEAASGGEEEEEGLSLEWPSNGSIGNKICYIILLPLVATLHLTVPDVRKEGQEGKYPISFVLSIIWIGVYSFFMVEWSGN
jgi:hypothetical protein